MQESMEFFLDEGLIHSVVRPIKHGKEALVHLCHAHRERTGHELAALKVFHPLDRRDFRAEAVYRQGDWFKDERVRRALESGSKFGREVQAATWYHREWATLQKLSETLVPTPEPNDAAIASSLANWSISEFAANVGISVVRFLIRRGAALLSRRSQPIDSPSERSPRRVLQDRSTPLLKLSPGCR
jgi:hypothetical protein